MRGAHDTVCSVADSLFKGVSFVYCEERPGAYELIFALYIAGNGSVHGLIGVSRSYHMMLLADQVRVILLFLPLVAPHDRILEVLLRCASHHYTCAIFRMVDIRGRDYVLMLMLWRRHKG